MNISENVKEILNQIDGRAILVAATKMNDESRIREAINAGVDYCGENRVQEMIEKYSLGAYTGAHLHFIGHLQKNKVKHVVGTCELIQSVDSIDLLNEIDREASKKGIVQDVLFEINIGNEETKSGFDSESIHEAFSSIGKNVFVRGLMCIPPKCPNSTEMRRFFKEMEHLFVDIDTKKYDNSRMDFLSMGMSHDFLEAIDCGSNMVRVGTGIFGPRNY